MRAPGRPGGVHPSAPGGPLLGTQACRGGPRGRRRPTSASPADQADQYPGRAAPERRRRPSTRGLATSRLRPGSWPPQELLVLRIRSSVGCALIIQTILLYPSGAVWTDEPPNASSPDPSGADQIDAEHQATDLAVGGSNPSRRAKRAGQRHCSKGIREAPDSGLIIPCRHAARNRRGTADEPGATRAPVPDGLDARWRPGRRARAALPDRCATSQQGGRFD